jgi:hypothetical protein
MRYAVCLESDTTGQSKSHVQGLPGCFAGGATAQAALDGLFTAIPGYWDWLRRHGVYAPGPDDLGEVTLGVVEIVRDSAPGAHALFEYEKQPLTPQGVAICLERLAYSRLDLLSLVGDLPAAAVAPGPEGSVGAILAHVAAMERWYTRLFAPDSRLKPGRTPLERLTNVRLAAVHHLSRLPEDVHTRIVERGGESWNVRKVLRRMIEHELEHIAQIALLLGADDPAPESGDSGYTVDNP